jgi:hypothetical protein
MLADSETNPLTGTNITYGGYTIVPYGGHASTYNESDETTHTNVTGTNLFYEPIPFEFIRTFEELPQLIVTVNDVPAVCHNLTCDFTYIEPVGMIDSFTYDHSTRILVLTGTDLPNVTANLTHVHFAHTHCTIDWDTVDNTSLTCTLDEDPTCGDHLPMLTSLIGIIPVDETVTAETITCVLTSVFPSSSFNLLGGDNLTFTGSMLPKVLSTSTVSIKFNDKDETICTP